MGRATYNYSKKNVLITGGGTGLGLATTKAFAAAGAKVIITGRREHVLKETCDELGENVSYIVGDVSDLPSIPELVKKAESEIGDIDILVNNAGINMKKDPLEVTDEEFNRIIQTNVNGLFALSREVAKGMVRRKTGTIINITSMAALYGIPFVSAYTASKTAVLGLTKSMAVDFSPHGINVNAVAPGFIDSPMLRKAFGSDPDRERRVLERTPMHSLGKPEDIAAAVLFLASDDAKFITGANLPVDGGNSIGF